MGQSFSSPIIELDEAHKIKDDIHAEYRDKSELQVEKVVEQERTQILPLKERVLYHGIEHYKGMTMNNFIVDGYSPGRSVMTVNDCRVSPIPCSILKDLITPDMNQDLRLYIEQTCQ